MSYPVVPEYITVHLGAPDAPAENVTVTFPRYIKGVAASEIYPTWNESAIRANVLAQISVALNRVYTEFYRSRGYDFDITNNTQYDQAFSPDKETFENINAIVDDMGVMIPEDQRHRWVPVPDYSVAGAPDSGFFIAMADIRQKFSLP